MRKIIYSAFAAMALVACTADFNGVDKVINTNSDNKIVNTPTDCVKGSILVHFTPSAESRLSKTATRSGATRTGIEGVDILLDKVNGYAVEPIFVVTEKNRDKVYASGLHLWYSLHFDEGVDVESLASELSDIAEVQHVQYNHKVCRVNAPTVMGENLPTILASTSSDSKIPFNDKYRDYLWSLNNLGGASKVGNAGYVNKLPSTTMAADINVLPAWKLCMGDPSIVVAVLDEGVMYTHEDLSSNIWINQAEKGGIHGVDDDMNGFIDDIYGFNFIFRNNSITWEHDNDSGHGTHVAGIISAMNNNGKGICGIAGGSGKNDGVKIMSLQVFYGNGGAKTDDMAKAMQYAADNGAHIMQCSWGYEFSRPSDRITSDNAYRARYRLEAQAIDYFTKYAGTDDGPIDGGVVIFAAGNSGESYPCYPAAYERCVAVAAFTPALKPAYYTNYGIGTDIAAPGGEAFYSYGQILSTVPNRFSNSGLENYAMMQGTSQACPHVSGVAALGLSYAKKLGKHFSSEEFRSMLISSTNDIDPYLKGSFSAPLSTGEINLDYPSFSGKLGAGYIDAYKLLLQVDGTPYNVVKCGVDSEIDLSTYLGDGLLHSELLKIDISDEDKANIGLGDCFYNAGKLTMNCSKVGVATVTVVMLVGGGSTSVNTAPHPTEVSKQFVVIAKDSVPMNNGWL